MGSFTPNRIPRCMYSGCKVASNSGHQGCVDVLFFCLPPPVAAGSSWAEAQQLVVSGHPGPKLCITLSLIMNSWSKLYTTPHRVVMNRDIKTVFCTKLQTCLFLLWNWAFEHGLLERLTHFWKRKWPFEELQLLALLCWLHFCLLVHSHCSD